VRREGNLQGLTDGKLYRKGDVAKLGCNDCEGCSACCRGMGNSVVLDPYDVWRLERGLAKPFARMIGAEVMLSVVDGLILPSLNMESTGTCPFLNEEGRCSIHAFRPGICRLFPLGRYYHDGGFSYVLMTGECKKENRTKVKIEKWLGEENPAALETFVIRWKEIQETVREEIAQLPSRLSEDEALAEQKRRSLRLLQQYYLQPYGENFFDEFLNRGK